MKAQERPSQPLPSPVPAALHVAGDGFPASSSAFLMRPDYLPSSAWLEHLPFAFWMVDSQRPRSLVELGTHWGASYFGFCQAVSRFGTNTACYAVDTWQGDVHAGIYGEEVFKRVRDHNRKNYSGFSTLIRSNFDEALPYFEDGSIDLLHIDGLHSYEAVRADFETWLPKLSDRAVVLMHDTNVRERDFGVFRFFAELRERHPDFGFFEFLHGHGLGVVGVGRDQPDSLRALFDADRDHDKTETIRRLFSHLGENCQERQALTALEADKLRLEDIIRTTRDQVKALEAKAAARNEAVNETLVKLKGQIKTLTERGEKQGQALTKSVSEREIQKKELAQAARFERENTRLNAELAELTRRLVLSEQAGDAARAATAKAKEAGSKTQRQLDKLADQVRAERLAAKERLATIQDNIRRLARALAPAQPSGLNVALSPALRALGRKMRDSGIVDEAWYLAKNPDVRDGKMDPSRHYALYGAAELRLPRDMAKPVE